MLLWSEGSDLKVGGFVRSMKCFVVAIDPSPQKAERMRIVGQVVDIRGLIARPTRRQSRLL